MHRFYKYLKSFDSFILQYSKPIGRILSVLAIGIIVYKIRGLNLEEYHLNLEFTLSWEICLGLILFFTLNHGLDAYIWRYVLSRGSISLSMKEALIMNWNSLLFALATPNRVGEIPARRLMLKNYDLMSVYKQASIHYLFKPFTFFLLILFSLYGINFESSFFEFSIVINGMLAAVFFGFNKSRMTIKLVGLNSLRVLCYCIQHGLILMALNGVQIDFSTINSILFIHSSGALLPHVFGTEVFIKSVIFHFFENIQLSWISFTASLVLLWIMNIVLPALIALGLKKS